MSRKTLATAASSCCLLRRRRWATRLPNSCASQTRVGWRAEVHAAVQRGGGDGKSAPRRQKPASSRRRGPVHAPVIQRSTFPAAGGFGAQQHRPAVIPDEAHQLIGRRLIAGGGEHRGLTPVWWCTGASTGVPQFEHRVVAEIWYQLLHRVKQRRAAAGRPNRCRIRLEPGVDLFPEMAGAAVMIAAGDNRGIVRQVIKQGGARSKNSGR